MPGINYTNGVASSEGTYGRDSSSASRWHREMCPGPSSIVTGSTTSHRPAHEPVAPRVEHAAGGRVGRARDLAAERNPLHGLTVDTGDRRQQGLGVRVVGTVEDLLGGAELHDAAEVHHRDPVAEIADHAEVVRDEQVARAVTRLKIGEHVQDRRLHRHVEGTRRLVAHDDPGITGEGAGDGDALLEATRQLTRLEVEMTRR